MNKLPLLISIIPVLLTFQACKSNIKNDSIVDSFTTVKRSDEKANIIVEKVDADFIAEAMQCSLAGIELGKLARQKGNNKRIKRFGMIMISGYAKISNKVKGLASARNISLPTTLAPGRLNEISILSKKSGNEFDKAYINNMIADYKKEIPVFEAAEKNCADPEVKSFAVKTLPLLHAHADAMNALSYSMQ
jgi:putative membrane protein